MGKESKVYGEKRYKAEGKKGREEERRERMERETTASRATKPGGGRRESWEAYWHGSLTTNAKQH